ncbi:hypothetical protein JCM9279_004105 [Rhodotorula babjevae]
MPSSKRAADSAVKARDTITLDSDSDSDDDLSIVDASTAKPEDGESEYKPNGNGDSSNGTVAKPDAPEATKEEDSEAEQRARVKKNMWAVVEKVKHIVDEMFDTLLKSQNRGEDGADDADEDDEDELTLTNSAKRKRGAKANGVGRKKKKVTAADLPPIEFEPSKQISGGTLKDYQRTGVNWLCTRYVYAIPGAILADEMGTGKTLQTIAVFAFILDNFYKPEDKATDKPLIVVLPKAVLRNWERELEKFAPSIPVLVYAGTPEERADLRQRRLGLRGMNNAAPFKRKDQFPVILVTYQILQRDINYLSQLQYWAVVCDEAHQAKNKSSKNFATIKRLNTEFRLLLTGTPLQNNLNELFTLLSFVFPAVFTDEAAFIEMFNFKAVTSGTSLELSEQTETTFLAKILTEILSPFTLRRRKKDVVKDLPLKKEYTLHAPLTALQKELLAAANISPNALRAAILNGGTVPPSALPSIAPSTTNSASASPAPGTPASDADSTSTPRKRVRRTRDIDIINPALLLDTHGPSSAGRKRRSGAVGRSYSDAIDAADDEDFEQQLVKKAEDEERRKEKAAFDKLQAGHSTDVAGQLKRTKFSSNLTNLRFLALHPLLAFDDRDYRQRPDEDVINLSGKMMLLDRLLKGLFARGSKVLIFSQFTKMMNLLEDAFDLRGWKYYRIDGANSADQEEIEQFNTTPYEPEGVNMFMLSTRAGGVGINLVGADTVILFDSDFNPQNDLQAMDRAHRIGQTKPVLVFRLVSDGTVEQAVLETATKKRKLERVVLGDDSLAGMNKLERKPKGGKKAAAAAAAAKKLTPGAASDELDKKSKEQALERMLKEVWSVEGQKVRLAASGDEVLSDEQLEQLLDRSDATMSSSAPLAGSALGAAAEVFATNDAEEGEEGADDKNEVSDLLREFASGGPDGTASASASATGSEAEDEDGQE